jgi:hypothetical protein
MAFLDNDRLDLAQGNAVHEIAEDDIRRRGIALLERRKEQKHHNEDDDPKGEVLVELLIHTMLHSPNSRARFFGSGGS